MNAGDYGIPFQFGTQLDMSAWTGVSIYFLRPDTSTITVSNPAVTVPNVNTGMPPNQFLANQYLQYSIAVGDLTIAGLYTARAIYTNANASPAIHLISDPVTFEVGTGIP